MAFPPNYRQERSNRERAKQRKAEEKRARREEKSSHRKADQDVTETVAQSAEKDD